MHLLKDILCVIPVELRDKNDVQHWSGASFISVFVNNLEKSAFTIRAAMASNAIEIFEVKLDEANRMFYPGDTVSGRVNLKLKEDLKIKVMRLECRGEAYVNWPQYSGSHTRYHYNKERYFSAMAVIFGEGKSL